MGGRNIKKNIFKSRKFKKVVAIALTVTTTTTLGNGGVYKSVSGVENASKPEQKVVKEKPKVLKELKDERTQNSNTYLMSDGSKKTEIHTDSIRFVLRRTMRMMIQKSPTKMLKLIQTEMGSKMDMKYGILRQSGMKRNLMAHTTEYNDAGRVIKFTDNTEKEAVSYNYVYTGDNVKVERNDGFIKTVNTGQNEENGITEKILSIHIKIF